MFGIRFIGNTHIPHYKNTAELASIDMPAPASVLLPMVQHIGAPATPIVNPGDTVKIGQKVAEASSYVSSPIFAPISGKVEKFEEFLRSDGKKVQAIRITSDGLMAVHESVQPKVVNNLDDLIVASRESGVVGLGGAGFPLSVKLDVLKKDSIDTVILNGAECEPYITSDTRTMIDRAEDIRYGVELLIKHAPAVKQYIIGIEKNKPEAIAKMKDTFSDIPNVIVKPLPPRYPQGAEKVLIYNTVRRVVPEGKLPSDVNVLVLNITSMAVLAKYCRTGMPLVRKSVTLDGSAVASPKNIKAPIGTSVKEIIDFGGGTKGNVGKILLGGPMMGSAIASTLDPIIKTTGAITILSLEDVAPPIHTACIRCGRCMEACPHLLKPVKYSDALKLTSREEKMHVLEENKIMLCVECGSCSFVCPAGRPLVLNNKIAKAEYREYLAEQNKK